MKRNSKRRKRRTKSSRGSILGSLLLELIAFAVLLLILSISAERPESTAAEDAFSYRTADVPTAISGFLSDQIDRQYRSAE